MDAAKIDVDAHADAGDPDKLYQDLLSRASSRRAQSLRILWQALSDLEADGIREYTIAAVGRRVEELGGPRTQSLRNADGTDFRRLIAAFGNRTDRGEGRSHDRQQSQVQKAISQVPDLGVQTILRMLLEENRRLKHQNDVLRESFKELSLSITESSMLNDSPELEHVAQRSLTGPLCESLALFLSDQWLESRGLRIEHDGSIVDSTVGDDVYLLAPPGFADALRLLVASPEEQQTVESNAGAT